MDEKKCTTCGGGPSPHSDITDGWGYDEDRNPYCYKCCANRDVAGMKENGRATLYYVERDGRWFVTNWPGSLSFPVTYRKSGRHNIAGTRDDYWFHGPDGHVWHGYTLGNFTQVAHCKRTKEKSACENVWTQ